MDLLNADGTDFSNEIVLQIALMLEMVNAAHLIAYRLDRILGNADLKSNLIRDRKLALSEAQKAARRVVTQFNAAFDGVFEKAAKMLEYYNVVEVNDGNRERVKKAIRKLQGAGYPISEMMEYYNKL